MPAIFKQLRLEYCSSDFSSSSRATILRCCCSACASFSLRVGRRPTTSRLRDCISPRISLISSLTCSPTMSFKSARIPGIFRAARSAVPKSSGDMTRLESCRVQTPIRESIGEGISECVYRSFTSASTELHDLHMHRYC